MQKKIKFSVFLIKVNILKYLTFHSFHSCNTINLIVQIYAKYSYCTVTFSVSIVDYRLKLYLAY